MPLPVAHGLIGASLVAALRDPEQTGGWKWLAFGAFLAVTPDFDCALNWLRISRGGWHHGFTHSIPFALVTIVVLRQWRVRSFLVFSGAYVSHTLLDFMLTESRGVSLWWPFTDRRYKLRLSNPIDYTWSDDSLIQAAVDLLKISLIELLIFGPILLAVVLVTPRKKMQTLEQKLATLEKCGICLSPPFTVKDLLTSVNDQDGYDTILVELGAEPDEEPFQKRSANVWHFDTEAIEDHGDYTRIAERMIELTEGSLQLQDINDYVDVENEEAWLSFTFKGKPMKFNFEVNDDWVDSSIFRRFTELLKESDSSKIYLYYDLGGQDCIIACVKQTEFECLKSNGIKFQPL